MGCRVVAERVDGGAGGGHGEVRMGRQFSVEYKERILAELDGAVAPGERGAILRREGLYWSTVSRWRQRRDAAVRAGLSDAKRGPKVDQLTRELRSLRRRNELLEERLKTAEALAEAQGKVSWLTVWLERFRRSCGWLLSRSCLQGDGGGLGRVGVGDHGVELRSGGSRPGLPGGQGGGAAVHVDVVRGQRITAAFGL